MNEINAAKKEKTNNTSKAQQINLRENIRDIEQRQRYYCNLFRFEMSVRLWLL